MKTITIILLIFAYATSIVSQNKGDTKVFLENKSKYNFQETLNKIQTEITSNNWKVISIHDLQGIMKKNGKDVAAVQVIETCNPKYAYQILSNDDEKIASNMLPCRISIYEKSNGDVFVSRLNAPILAAQLGGITGEVMTEAFEEIEKVIESALK